MLRKYKNVVKRFYTGLCDVYEYKDIKVGNITKKAEEKVYEGIPCRLSYSADSKTANSDVANIVGQTIKLFLDSDIVIKSGSKIVVTQNGRTIEYKNSGEAMVYQTHQEIMLELFKGWA
ncbi:MAG: hypothetical protein ACI4VF_03565 [Lachnospirales bacterium]